MSSYNFVRKTLTVHIVGNEEFSIELLDYPSDPKVGEYFYLPDFYWGLIKKVSHLVHPEEPSYRYALHTVILVDFNLTESPF